jgi:hypothetical protein
LSSCYLYTGQCRVEEINPPAQSWEECSSRGAALLKTLNHTIGDDGWTPVGISCSLQTQPASQVPAGKLFGWRLTPIFAG